MIGKGRCPRTIRYVSNRIASCLTNGDTYQMCKSAEFRRISSHADDRAISFAWFRMQRLLYTHRRKNERLESGPNENWLKEMQRIPQIRIASPVHRTSNLIYDKRVLFLEDIRVRLLLLLEVNFKSLTTIPSRSLGLNSRRPDFRDFVLGMKSCVGGEIRSYAFL